MTPMKDLKIIDQEFDEKFPMYDVKWIATSPFTEVISGIKEREDKIKLFYNSHLQQAREEICKMILEIVEEQNYANNDSPREIACQTQAQIIIEKIKQNALKLGVKNL